MYLLATAVLLCHYIASNAFPFAPVEDEATVLQRTVGDLTFSSPTILNAHHIPGRNCKEIQDEGFTESGLYNIQLSVYSNTFTVFCDMSLRGGGWMVILRRVDGTVDFDRNWASYTRGFGNLGGSFFLGLEKIWLLTRGGNMELHVGLGHPSKELLGYQNAYAATRYSHFEVGSNETKYNVSVSGYESRDGDAGDSLKFHDGMAFSTYDADNDIHDSAACAQRYSGGWWFHNCFESNLNGKYYENNHDKGSDGVIWKTWAGERYSLGTAVMAIRPSATV